MGLNHHCYISPTNEHSVSWCSVLPSGKHTKNYGKSPCSTGRTHHVRMIVFPGDQYDGRHQFQQSDLRIVAAEMPREFIYWEWPSVCLVAGANVDIEVSQSFFFPCQICQYRLIFHILSRTKQSVYCLPNVVTSRTNKIFVKAWPDVIDSGKFDHWDRHNIITLFLVVPTICDKDMVMICNDIVIIWQSYVKSNYAWTLRVTQFT